MVDKLYKPTNADLILLDELSQPNTLLEIWSGLHSRIRVVVYDESWNQISEKDKVHWPRGDFFRAGLVRRISEDEFVKMFGEISRHFARHLDVITPQGRALLEANRARLDKIKATKAEEQTKADRLVICAYASGWGGGRNAGRTYCALLRVLRETDNRLYVKPVMTARDITDGTGSFYGQSPVHGRDNEQYVSRNDILVDPATEDQFRSLVRLDDERMTSTANIKQREEDELAPIRKRWEDLRKQQAVMFEEMEQDILKPK